MPIKKIDRNKFSVDAESSVPTVLEGKEVSKMTSAEKDALLLTLAKNAGVVAADGKVKRAAKVISAEVTK